MNFYSTLFYVVLGLLVGFAGLKTFLFITRISTKTFLNWFAFNKYQIFNSRSAETAKAKRIQNVLSVVLLIIFMLDVILLYMSLKP